MSPLPSVRRDLRPRAQAVRLLTVIGISSCLVISVLMVVGSESFTGSMPPADASAPHLTPARLTVALVRDFNAVSGVSEVDELLGSLESRWSAPLERDHGELLDADHLRGLLGPLAPPPRDVQRLRLRIAPEWYVAEYLGVEGQTHIRANGRRFSAALLAYESRADASITGPADSWSPIPSELLHVFDMAGWSPRGFDPDSSADGMEPWRSEIEAARPGSEFVDVHHPFLSELAAKGKAQAAGGVRLRRAAGLLPVRAWIDYDDPGQRSFRVRSFIQYFELHLPYPRRMLRVTATKAPGGGDRVGLRISTYEAEWDGECDPSVGPCIPLRPDTLIFDKTGSWIRRYAASRGEEWSPLCRFVFR